MLTLISVTPNPIGPTSNPGPDHTRIIYCTVIAYFTINSYVYGNDIRLYIDLHCAIHMKMNRKKKIRLIKWLSGAFAFIASLG